jgi:hypothetical protein
MRRDNAMEGGAVVEITKKASELYAGHVRGYLDRMDVGPLTQEERMALRALLLPHAFKMGRHSLDASTLERVTAVFGDGMTRPLAEMMGSAPLNIVVTNSRHLAAPHPS